MTTVQLNNHNPTVNTNIKLLESNPDSLTTTAQFEKLLNQTIQRQSSWRVADNYLAGDLASIL